MRTPIRLWACAIVLAATAFSLRAGAAELSVRPSLNVSEEYNDNILLLPNDREDDFITRVLPSILFRYKAPFWDWDVAYAYDYRHYARHEDVDTSTHTARVENNTRVIKEFLFLDARDDYERVSLSLARDYTKESLFINQSDRNILSLSPYAVLHPGTNTTLTAAYSYRNVWFKDPNAVDRTDHVVSAEAKKEASPRLSFTMGLKYTSDINRIEGYRRSDAVFSSRYEFAADSHLWLSAGDSLLAFEKTGTTRQFTWGAEFVYKRPLHTLTLEAGLDYIDDPLDTLQSKERYVATLKSGTERTSLELSAGLLEYREAVSRLLEARTYRVRAAVGHAFSPTWRGLCDLSAERFNDKLANAVSVRYITDVRFDYEAAESLTLSLEYLYTDSHSPDFYLQDYSNNRVILEARQAF